jgi:radical SAM protein with 4Fe4S-binding SPASM domain
MSPNTLHHALTLIEDVNDTRLYQNTSYDYPEEVKSGIIDLINYIFEKRKKSKVDIGFTDDFKSKTDLINFIRSPKDFSVQECNRPWHEFLLYYDGKTTSCLGYLGENIRMLNYKPKKVFTNSKYQKFLSFIKQNEPNSKACASCKEAPLRKN